jgi:hypothetical protein
MGEVSDQHVERDAADDLQGVALQYFCMRDILPENSDEPFIKFDNREAPRSGKCPRDGADSRSGFQDLISGADACCLDQFRQLLAGYQEVLTELRVCAGSHLAVARHYTGA